MIRKIKTTEYLKQYGAMSDGERREYQRRVGEWLAQDGARLYELTDRPMAKAQNMVLMSARWTKEDCQAFQDGALLLSALAGQADTWLPTQLYAKSAFRAVRQMVRVLVVETHPQSLPAREGSGYTQGERAAAMQGMTPAAKPQGTLQAGKGAGTTTDAEIIQRAMRDGQTRAIKELEQRRKAGTPAGKPQGTLPAKVTTPLPRREGQGGGSALVRPRHIDQYVHLLPEATQKRAAGYGELMREFDEAREKLRIVMDDPCASDRERQGWATKVRNLDGQIGAIRRELDAEWEKVAASGRVVMDELGMAHLINPTPDPSPKERGVDTTDGEPEAIPETKANQKADNERKAALLRKWLIDTRYGNKDAEKRAKYQQKWREKYREMVRLGGIESVTEKVKAAAEHYGIDLAELSSTTN